MRKKRTSTRINVPAIILIGGLLGIWQIISMLNILPSYMLPSPVAIVQALVSEASVLLAHSKITLIEAGMGLAFGVLLGVLLALVMDCVSIVQRAMSPLIVISQTVPSVALAPILVLWFGYGALPKILLIVSATFFPIAVGMYEAFGAVDGDKVQLMQTMGAKQFDVYRHLKLPEAASAFFAALRISASYSIVGAVVAEWLGGSEGLGVYMIRVKKSFAFEKMFAVILLIAMLSLALMKLVDVLRDLSMPWMKDNRKGDIQ